MKEWEKQPLYVWVFFLFIMGSLQIKGILTSQEFKYVFRESRNLLKLSEKSFSVSCVWKEGL